MVERYREVERFTREGTRIGNRGRNLVGEEVLGIAGIESVVGG